LSVTGPQRLSTNLDLAVDWRAHPHVHLDVGSVLVVEDAVGNKVAALFSRAETRDYLDVDAIRRSGRYGDGELLDLARRADPGFDLEQFSRSLEGVERLRPEEVLVYGVTPDELEGVKTRIRAWAASIRGDGCPGPG